MSESVGGSAEPVAPPPHYPLPRQALLAADMLEIAALDRPDAEAAGYRQCADGLRAAALARAPQDDNDASRHVRDAGWQVVKELREVGSCSLGALDALDHALGAYDSPARAPQGDPPEDTVWLIERDNSNTERHGVIQWWSADCLHPWTTDAICAVRFARKLDADRVIDGHGELRPAFATEHLWTK